MNRAPYNIEDLAENAGSTVRQSSKPTEFVEVCAKCRGTGRFRHLGPCFACKGDGKLKFKTSPEERQKARSGAAMRKVSGMAANLDAFAKADPVIWSWIDGNDFAFAKAMHEAIAKYGELTENQRAACERLIAKRDAAKAAAIARVENAAAVDVSPIMAAFDKASKVLKRPKLNVAGFTFSFAKAGSANAGALYVKASGEYLGKVAGGKFIPSRQCDQDSEAQIVEALADPKGAAVKHGRLTGACAICNRKLTNRESVELGIGPICAENFGW